MNDATAILQERISNWKKSLLDMTKRNRLLWYKPYRVGSLKLTEDTFDEKANPEEIIHQLLNDSKSIEFISDLPILPPEPREGDSNYEDKFEDYKRLKNIIDKIKPRNKALEIIRRKIKTENDEKGLNIGYISAGFLKWYEREDASKEILSPLIMIPITIEQESRKAPFIVQLNIDEEITINPVIIKKFQSDFNIDLATEEYTFTDINSVLNIIKDDNKLPTT